MACLRFSPTFGTRPFRWLAGWTATFSLFFSSQGHSRPTTTTTIDVLRCLNTTTTIAVDAEVRVPPRIREFLRIKRDDVTIYPELYRISET